MSKQEIIDLHSIKANDTHGLQDYVVYYNISDRDEINIVIYTTSNGIEIDVSVDNHYSINYWWCCSKTGDLIISEDKKEFTLIFGTHQDNNGPLEIDGSTYNQAILNIRDNNHITLVLDC